MQGRMRTLVLILGASAPVAARLTGQTAPFPTPPDWGYVSPGGTETSSSTSPDPASIRVTPADSGHRRGSCPRNGDAGRELDIASQGRLRRHRSHRGQSLVEFALVLPMLLVLLFGVADFGRIFQAGITVEASARNASEIAAQEYVQLTRNKPGGVLDPADYDRLHDVAIEALCGESELLPQVEAPPGASGVCVKDLGGGPVDVWPLGGVCVHDNVDPICGDEANTVPSSCPRLDSGWSNANNGAAPVGSTPLPYVEVRVCYQFTTLFNLTDLELPFGWSISFGTIYLERDRTFTVACYQSAVGPCV